MTDKLPTEIVICPSGDQVWSIDNATPELAYVLKHNNPDYHVIPKADVDGDVMGALNLLGAYISDLEYLIHDEYDDLILSEKDFDDFNANIILNKIRNALIAQSDQRNVIGIEELPDDEFQMIMDSEIPDPDMVTIPRKVLEGRLNKFDGVSESPECACVNCRFKQGQNQAINEVLNYKEGG